ncbi:unnamed protein product [Knipowitschia caucasica]
MWASAALLLLWLTAVQPWCSSGPSFPSSVLPPVALGRPALLRVPSASSVMRCVDAACALPWADVAWLFEGSCYVLSCHQRELCEPQRRPGAQSQLVFLQRERGSQQGRGPALLPPQFWDQFQSSEPGDLEDLRDLVLLGSQQDYTDPDLLMDYPHSNLETDPANQSQLKNGLNQSQLNQSQTANETIPTDQPQRPLQVAVTSQIPPPASSAPPTHSNQEKTSPVPVVSALTSLPVSNAASSESLSVTPDAPPLQSLHTGDTPDAPPPQSLHTGDTPDAPPPQSLHTGDTPDAPPPQSLHTGDTPDAPPLQSLHTGDTPDAPPPQSLHTDSVKAPPSAPPTAVCPSPTAHPDPGSDPPKDPNHKPGPGPSPVAHAGGSYTLLLPDTSLQLRGSVTNVDPATVRWEWSRDLQSPAAGDVLFGSQSSPTLVLVNLVQGSYLFHLRVTDALGRRASATATVEVLPEDGGGEEVEMELQVGVSQVSVSQKDTILSQISALLQVPKTDVQLRGLSGHAQLSTVLRLSVRSGSGAVSGLSVVSRLKTRLLDDGTDFLLFRVLRVDTVVCQLHCSGRGQCDPVSRSCVCDPFWTENLLKTYMGDGESNCEWRVVYVILSGFILVLLILTAAWTFMCCCRKRRPSRVRRKTRYTILDNVDEQERVELRPRFSLKHRSTEHNSSLMMSESELSEDFCREPLRSRTRTKPGLNQD